MPVENYTVIVLGISIPKSVTGDESRGSGTPPP